MPTIRVEGRPAEYLVVGRKAEGAAAPLLCVHGFTGSKEDFATAADLLATARPVYALDLPGRGGSPGPEAPGAYGLTAVARWVEFAIGALGLEEVHLLGHSLGGLVAQRVATSAPHRLRSLVLADSGLGAPRPQVREGITEIARAVQDGGMAAGWAARALAMSRRRRARSDPERGAFEQQRFLGLQAAAVVGEARALRTATSQASALRGLDLPVLILHGEGDDVWPEPQQRRLARAVAGARRVVVPDCAHAPQVENPLAWSREVGAFLTRTEGPAAPGPRPSGDRHRR